MPRPNTIRWALAYIAMHLPFYTEYAETGFASCNCHRSKRRSVRGSENNGIGFDRDDGLLQILSRIYDLIIDTYNLEIISTVNE